MKIQSKKMQRGWTTMEYVVGAILIISIVGTVIASISSGLTNKATKIETQLSN